MKKEGELNGKDKELKAKDETIASLNRNIE
jgi:hypothetical protein